MPFERYFERDDPHEGHSCESSTLEPTSLFQLPQFMQNVPSIVTPDGGAEFLSAGYPSAWFTNNFYFHDSTHHWHQPYASISSFSSLSNALHFPSLTTASVTPKKPAIQPEPRLSNPYSSSGFDFLPLLARVVSRPHPLVTLGHVDLSCSFVVVDVRRHDSPIVYCSPTFCRLTGYDEHEIIGRNCRFLQSPNGTIQRGELRQHSTPTAIAHLRKSLAANKECQTSITNYRKGGAAFTNLLTVIPIPGGVNGLPHEADDYVYHIGFQIDLKEPPQAIQRLSGVSHVVADYALSSIPPVVSPSSRDHKFRIPSDGYLSAMLLSLFKEPLFIQSIPMSSVSPRPAPSAVYEKVEDEAQHVLNMLLLERSPDFVHVVSLKGSFLYVAPSVRNVLGYEPEELIGKSISEFCHPADLVPLMRELKESSVNSQYAQDSHSCTSAASGINNIVTPKTVDILFRAKSKDNGYIWIECRGRLHIEPGKGRKAIILSGRARQMPYFKWESIARAGGLIPDSYAEDRSVYSHHRADNKGMDAMPHLKPFRQEAWGMMMPSGTLLYVEGGIRDVLGWETDELVGKDIAALCVSTDVDNNDHGKRLRDALASASERNDGGHSTVRLVLQRKDGHPLDAVLILFSSLNPDPSRASSSSSFSPPCPLVFQFRLACLSPDTRIEPLIHQLDSNVFEELETSRGTSWQYELQQLKFANQRLAQEIRELEQKQLATRRYAEHHSPRFGWERMLKRRVSEWSTIVHTE